MRRRAWISGWALLVALIGAVALRLSAGGVDGLALPDHPLVWELRGLRVVAGLVVGASLAVGGVLMQSLLRNPLASPDLLGLSAGAGLAVVISMYIGQVYAAPVEAAGAGAQALGAAGRVGAAAGLGLTGGWTMHTIPALAGSLGALALVFALSRRRGMLDPTALVLIGVIISIMCGAGIMLVQHLMPDRGFSAGYRVLIGSLSDDTGWVQLAAVGVVAVVGMGIGLLCGRAMDAASFGDDEARSVGVSLGRLRLILFAVSGVLTAGAVMIAGPIGFVGLVCPHVVRLMLGPGGGGLGHRAVIIGSAAAGGALMVLADGAVKAINLASGRLPVGVITALVGGPVFIALLRSQRRGAD